LASLKRTWLAYLNRKTRLSSGFIWAGGEDEIQLEHLEGILKVVEEIIKGIKDPEGHA